MNTAKEANWIVLFDGTDLSHWQNFGREDLQFWSIQEGGVLQFDAPELTEDIRQGKSYDIVTKDAFSDFELELEWKISECGNSGIMHHVVDDGTYDYPWRTGPEMQVLDNECHEDAKIHKHRAGDLYDMIACNEEVVKPAGEWNQIRILSNGGATEYWVNGVEVVKFTMWNDDWREMIADSKFSDMDGFGAYKEGKICLQDHGDLVWYRNIRIRPL